MGCRARCYDSISTVISVSLYFFDFVTDIVLAVEYFTQGHKIWGILTTVCIAFPILVYLALVLYKCVAEKDCKQRLNIIPALFCLPFLLINNSCGLILYTWLILKDGRKNKKDLFYRMATLSQTLEAICESSPQLILQLYILLVDESIASLKDIGISQYLCVLSSFAMLSWSFVSYEKMLYYMKKADKMSPCRQFCDFLVKMLECLMRVFAFALFLSCYSTIFLLLFIGINVFNFIVFTCVDMYVIENKFTIFTRYESKKQKLGVCMYASFSRIICYTSSNEIPHSKRRIVIQLILDHIENIACVVVWVFCNPDRHQSLEIIVIIIMSVLLIFTIIAQAVYYSCTYYNDDITESIFESKYSRMGKEFCMYIACPFCTYKCHEDRTDGFDGIEMEIEMSRDLEKRPL